MRKAIAFFYSLLLVLTPLVFYPKTSEVFELNKMVVVYGLTTLIMGAWAVRMMVEKRIVFRRTILDIPLVIFLVTLLISSLFSIDVRTSILGYYSRFNGGFLPTFCYALLYWGFVANTDRENALKIIRFALLAGVAVAVWGVLEHFGYSASCLVIKGEFNVDCWVQDTKTRVFATLGQPNWLAAYLVAILPLALSRFRPRNPKSALWLMASALMFAAILFTKSRSGLLGLGAVALIFLGRRFIPVALVLWALVSPLTARAQPMAPGGTESGEIRRLVWQGALETWKHYPLLGSGPETFAFVFPKFRPVAHNLTSEWDFIYNRAHNEFLNMAATTGTLGLTSYLALIGFALYQIVVKKSELSTALLAGFVSILVTNFFGFSVVTTSLFFFLIPAFAVTVTAEKEQRVNSKKMGLSQKVIIGIILLMTSYLLLKIGRFWYADTLYATRQLINLERAAQIMPKEPLYHSRLAEAQAAGAESPEEAQGAAETIDDAVTLAPRNLGVRRNRVRIYADLAYLEPAYILGAISEMQTLTALAPTDPSIYFGLALLYDKIGQEELTREALEKAVELKANYKEARYSLAALYKKVGEEGLARRQLEYILTEISPDDTKIQKELDEL